ncbi:LAMI_0G02102g1_1 [Lachancea mirantina]|uniref:LAMI_0G02102g1_1 n=1 Tax=Lachancea mirantina TaxID=1230905 RepID=A0A1G4K7S6_9SACH|nr:LAMI_0G02102g1_1 [Lachancea mirantina]
MAPFKFGKKLGKDKAKPDQKKPEPSSPINSGVPANFTRPSTSPPVQRSGQEGFSQAPGQNNQIPQARSSRVLPPVGSSQLRNVSSASALQAAEFTPWARTKLANTPFPRYRHVASAQVSDMGQIFVIGGLHDQSVYGDTWIIQARGDGHTFAARTVDISDTTPPPRVGHAATLCGNAFVVFGGDTHKVNSEGLMDDDIYLFNINSYKWTIPQPVGPRPLGRYGHKIAVIATTQMKTKLYVFGGQFDDTYFNDLAVFDLSSFRRPNSQWQFIKPNSLTPPPLTNHVMVAYDYKLWVFGGDTHQGLINDVYVFDPNLNNWQHIETAGEKPPPVQEHSAVLLGELMCVMGGKDEQDSYLNCVYFLNLRTWKWFKLPHFKVGIPQGRSGHSLTVLGNKKILVMGGDKFDYAKIAPDDMHTSNTDTGCGTILYTLDLSNLKELCPGIYEGATADASSRSAKRQDIAENQNILTPNPERYTTPKTHQDEFSKRSVSGGEEPTTPRNQPDFHGAADQLTQEIKKPVSPIPKLSDVNLAAKSPPPRVISLSSNNDSEQPSYQEDHDETDQSIAVPQNLTFKHQVANTKVIEKTPNDEIVETSSPAAATSSPQATIENINESITPGPYKRADMLYPQEQNSKLLLKATIDELKQELQNLKAEAETKAVSASNRIKELESENAALRSEENASSKHTLQTNYDMVVADKTESKSRISELEGLLSNKFVDVARLHDIIKAQSAKLEEYDDNESLKARYDSLKHNYELLQKEMESSRTAQVEENRLFRSELKTYTAGLGELLGYWKENGLPSSASREAEESREKLVSNLTSKIDTLMGEKKELQATLEKMETDRGNLAADHTKLEEHYKNSLNSVDNANRALAVCQEELHKMKQEKKRLADELEEWRYKNVQRADTSLTSNDDSVGNTSVTGTPDPNSEMRDAPWRLKIKDLKAELFIIKQERDSLKDDVLELKKKLLNLDNDDY